MSIRTISVCLVPAPALVLAYVHATHAHMQNAPTGSASIPAAQTAPASAAGLQNTTEDDPLKIFRAPLLREGSSLVEAVARLERDADQNWWTLTVEPRDSGEPDYKLAVLPCMRLAEMERILETMPSDVTFQVTGRVYVYRDGNYLLPSHAAVVGAAAPSSATVPPSPPVTSAPASAPDAEGEQATQPAGGGRDSAQSIMSELEQQAGPIARSSATGARAARSGSSTAHGAGGPDAAPSAAASLQENSAVVNRRGKITRDRSGGWMLVLDADASGLADPPLKLLPCMLLESIEDYARRVGNNSPIVVTGQVFLYSGQNYLLPTVYRIPRESSRLTP